MPRRREVTRREILADPKYKNTLVAKFTNKIMEPGKKSVAERILYHALEIIQEKTKEDPLKVFEKSVGNVKPVIEVKSRRVGGATYQVPTEIRPERRTALAIRWLIAYAQERSERRSWRPSFWTRPTTAGAPLRNEKTFIRWPRRIKPSLTIDGKDNYSVKVTCFS
jgi:small subunit ribosomal protein S7